MYRHFKQIMKEHCFMVTCVHKIMKMCKICIDRDFSNDLLNKSFLLLCTPEYAQLEME